LLSTRITFGRGHKRSSFFSVHPLLCFLFLSAFSFTSSSFSRSDESFRNRSKKLLLLVLPLARSLDDASFSSLLGGGKRRRASFSIDAFDSQIQSEMKCDSCEERKEIRNVFISSLYYFTRITHDNT